ncbi:hypothetical protein [Niallia sp. Krafla_26]|uniref:hypothetical protein n=1 Tax=Niallia sp. Krafla_26 TaxID=3064703 RepID=UPI003D180C42
MKDDWKRAIPNEGEREVKEISVSNRNPNVSTEKEEPSNRKTWWKNHHKTLIGTLLGFAVTLSGVIWTMVGVHDRGFEKGKEEAEKELPAEYIAVKESLTISENRNIELLAENTALKEEINMLNKKLEEINTMIENAPEEMESRIPNKLLEVEPESNVIHVDESEGYFEDELFISVVEVAEDEHEIDTTTISANVPGSTPETFPNLKVGSKVEYKTSSFTYEILVTAIKYSTNVGINVIKFLNTNE